VQFSDVSRFPISFTSISKTEIIMGTRGISLGSIFLILAIITFSACSDSRPIAPSLEGVDRESPEEIEAARQRIESEFADAIEPDSIPHSRKATTLDRYSHLDPKKWVPTNLLKNAILYYDANQTKFPNKNYVTIVDFSPRSDRYRFFLVNLNDGSVERYRTTHGVGSDVDDDGFAESFGNVLDSGKSSLGYARVGEVYSGTFKRSLRLDGLSSTNSRMRERAIVFHGWDGVKETGVIQQRSWGCITLEWTVKDAVLDKIKNGSLIYSGLSVR
jgi:hypothetical protein